jgi:hypothetical protein
MDIGAWILVGGEAKVRWNVILMGMYVYQRRWGGIDLAYKTRKKRKKSYEMSFESMKHNIYAS